MREAAVALGKRRDHAEARDAGAEAGALPVGKEEGLVLFDAPSNGAAVLVPAEGRDAGGCLPWFPEGIKEVAGVERGVAVEIVGAAVKLIGAGLGDRVDLNAGRTSLSGVESVGDHFELRDRVLTEARLSEARGDELCDLLTVDVQLKAGRGRFGDEVARGIVYDRIDLTVPPQYKEQKQRFIALVAAMYLTQEPKINSERIKFYVETSDITSNGCIIPTAISPLPQGYYRIQFKGIEYMLHRIILCKKVNKDYKDKFIARHLCNNRNCINLEHLEIGTNKDNSLDSREYSKKTKLTKEQVISVKKDMIKIDFSKYGEGIKFDKYWSLELGVSKSAISNIRYGNTWKDIIV